MATKQSSRPSSPKRTPAAKSTPRGRSAAPAPARTPLLRTAFDGHALDAWGLVLITAGLVAGLGIYLDVAGPAGGAIDTAAGAIVGLARFLVPPALLAAGYALIRHQPSDEDRGVPVRVTVGSFLLLVGGTGLMHVWVPRPAGSEGIDSLMAGGGLLGAATGAPLEAVVWVWGATLLLVTVVLLGVIVLTHLSLRSATVGLTTAVAGLGRGLAGMGGALFRGPGDATTGDDVGVDPAVSPDGSPTMVVGGRTIDLTGPDEAPPLFDQDDGPAAAALAAPPTPRRRTPAAVVEETTVDPTQLHIDLGPAVESSVWKLPKAEVLNHAGPHTVDHKAVEETGRVLEQALAEHGVETRLVGMVVGPTVTRYELELGPGVKVARVTSLHKDIAYAMASPDVRILAPIPGRQAIGVEVPNAKRELVALGDLLTSPEAKKATHPLEVALGRDINGASVMANLAQMPHLLIAGATGAGKSSCINSIITSMLMRATPDQVRMILVDPKRVELTQYAKLPHLLTEVVTDPKKAANALDWAVREMDRRYEVLEAVAVRDITGYNAAYDRGDLRDAPGAGEMGPDGEPLEYQRLPFIVIVVDELNDLMMVAARDVEASICRIAQKARAVGIHLVLATQRPSVNVITGLIKANIPSRIAFAVSSLADSRVILDQAGAERLIGKGDMLVLTSTSSLAQRIQGAWVTEEEVRDVAKAWRKQAPDVAYLEEVQAESENTALALSGGGSSGSGASEDDDDDLLAQAMELVVRSQLGSTSMLQRKLRVGFARAGRIMDLLEQRGVVGPSEGSKARAVLMTPEELGGGAELDDDPDPTTVDVVSGVE
ncbi:MAG: DNA translocase FtsK [Acidimicrobiales bacterium]